MAWSAMSSNGVPPFVMFRNPSGASVFLLETIEALRSELGEGQGRRKQTNSLIFYLYLLLLAYFIYPAPYLVYFSPSFLLPFVNSSLYLLFLYQRDPT